MKPYPRLKLNVNVGRKPGETYRDSQWSIDSLKFLFGVNKHDIITNVLSIGTIILLAVSAFLFRSSNDTFLEPKKLPSTFNEISHYEKNGKIYYVISCEKR